MIYSKAFKNDVLQLQILAILLNRKIAEIMVYWDIVNFQGSVAKKFSKFLRLKNIHCSFTPSGLKMSNLNPIEKRYERYKSFKCFAG